MVVLQSRVANALSIRPAHVSATTNVAGSDEPRAFESPAEQEIARLAYDRIRALSTRALPLGSQEIADTASASLFRYDVNGDNLEVHSDFPVDLRVRQDSA